MLTYKQYCRQLQELSLPDIHGSECITKMLLTCFKNGDEMVIRVKPTQKIIHRCILECIKVNYIDLKISYSKIYQEPILLLQIWIELNPDDDKNVDIMENIDNSKLFYPKGLQYILNIPPDQYEIELDTLSGSQMTHNSAWYSFHPCNTSNMIGSDSRYLNSYLQRWVSVFIISWWISNS